MLRGNCCRGISAGTAVRVTGVRQRVHCLVLSSIVYFSRLYMLYLAIQPLSCKSVQ